MSFNPGAGTFSGSSDVSLSGTSDNQLIGYDSATDKWTNRTPEIIAVAGLQAALDAKLSAKNNIVELTDSTNDHFARVNITDDASPTEGWTDRLAFYYDGIRAGYFNEYGELRARPAKPDTVAFRAMSRIDASDTNDILQIAQTGSDNVVLGVSKKYLTNNGLTKNNIYATDPGGSYIERTDLNYTVGAPSPDIEQIRINGTTAYWRNEWGGIRGTSPYSWGDPLVRAVRTDSDVISTPTNNAFEINDSRTGAIHPTMWGRSWVDGSLVRNGNTMADTYVMENGGTPPGALPAGTVIIELDA